MTDLHITGPNSDGEYWLHIKADGKMGGINLGASHGPIVKSLLDTVSRVAIEAPAQKPVAQCCMCGKGGVSTAEDGTPGCELPDGRWVCSGECWDRAASWPVPDQTQPDALALVAAAYRDAEDKARYDYRDWDNATPIECDATACEYVADAISKLTPADAEAHLTALLRAEYERGVRGAAGLPAFDCTGDPCGTFDGKVFVKLDAILALLTQEGR